MSMEKWRTIPGFDYQASYKGVIKRKDSNELSPSSKRKYKHVTLFKKGERYCRLVHRLVALAWISNPHNLPEVNHKDGNTHNNSVENLEWVSKSENEKHAHKKGLKKAKRGEKNVLCKINDSDVLNLRNKYKSGRYTTRSLANEYGISCGYVSILINKKRRCQ